MPTWLVHGFRWPRPLVRIHIILNNIDDAAAEWLMGPATSASLIENLQTLYPDIMANLSSLRFIEQYDPDDLVSKDQPYAYVCDQIHEVQLGVDVDEVRGKGVANEAWAALAELRDKVAPGEKVAWFVVVNGDVERWVPPLEEDGSVSQSSPVSSNAGRVEESSGSDKTERQPRGFKKWFGKARRSKSSKDLRSEMSIRTMPQSPPPTNTTIPHPKIANGKAPVVAGTAV
ncbi:hypothetical protein P154DRAFT_169000 [Amniculicola lignicola CBS 123094]|uniref:Developmental regulator protein n=1 Tax=Amniculicola lignicola CBS 123094 TaxID=1392246 RepID=A0A6A5WUX1_9PLEO|nr:hypothetical protein P154DRAFT_169000 [Amniculicola lignicola CBS 123094]